MLYADAMWGISLIAVQPCSAKCAGKFLHHAYNACEESCAAPRAFPQLISNNAEEDEAFEPAKNVEGVGLFLLAVSG